jgi:uncharacterized membrane protein YhaH (DUF805 family)
MTLSWRMITGGARLGRAPYCLGVFLIFTVLALMASWVMRSGNTFVSIVYFTTNIVIIWLTGRRAADTNFSPWWPRSIVTLSTIFTIYFFNSHFVSDRGVFTSEELKRIMLLILLCLGIPFLVLIALALPRGTTGRNRYGPSPAEEAAARAAPKIFE